MIKRLTILIGLLAMLSAPAHAIRVYRHAIGGVTAGTGLTGGGNSGVVTINSVVNVSSVIASGTAYSLTATTAAVTFGTTSPLITVGSTGTYLIMGRVNIKYNGATYAANQTIKLVLRRTNNTAAYITNSETNITTRIITTITDDVGDFLIPPQIYTTTTSGDGITIFANVSAVPGAGSVDINEANIIAVRLY